MIDRFGHKVSIAWPEHHLLWIEAALTLPHGERQEAYADIAFMTGRSMEAIRHRAKTIRGLQKRQAEAAERKRVIRTPAHWALTPSFIAPPSKARLMAGRA